jgi:hypothetical protein
MTKSLLAHKEFRFLAQIVPFSMILCAYGLEYFEQKFSRNFYVNSLLSTLTLA